MTLYNNRDGRLRDLVKDAKANGFIYVKSYLTAREIEKLNDPSIVVEYDREDDFYIVRRRRKSYGE